MSIDVRLTLAQALPQIVGGADIEMTGHGNLNLLSLSSWQVFRP